MNPQEVIKQWPIGLKIDFPAPLIKKTAYLRMIIDSMGWMNERIKEKLVEEGLIPRTCPMMKREGD